MAAVEKRFHDPEREAKDREFNEMLKVMKRIERIHINNWRYAICILKAIDMDSAKRLHSVKSKKRELRGAQRASRKKIDEIKKVSQFISTFI